MASLSELANRLKGIGPTSSGSDSGSNFTFAGQGKNWTNSNKKYPWQDDDDIQYEEVKDEPTGPDKWFADLAEKSRKANEESGIGKAFSEIGSGDIGKGLVDLVPGILTTTWNMPADIVADFGEMATGKKYTEAENGIIPDGELSPLQRAAAGVEGAAMLVPIAGAVKKGVSTVKGLGKAVNAAKGIEEAATKEAALPFKELADQVSLKKTGEGVLEDLAAGAGEGVLFGAAGNVREKDELNAQTFTEGIPESIGTMVGMKAVTAGPTRAIQAVNNYKIKKAYDAFENKESRAQKKADELSQQVTPKQYENPTDPTDYANEFLNRDTDAYYDFVANKSKDFETPATTSKVVAHPSLRGNQTLLSPEFFIGHYKNDPDYFWNEIVGKKGEHGLNHYGRFDDKTLRKDFEDALQSNRQYVDNIVNGEFTLRKNNPNEENYHIVMENNPSNANSQKPTALEVVGTHNDPSVIPLSSELAPFYNVDQDGDIIKVNGDKSRVQQAKRHYDDFLYNEKEKNKYYQYSQITPDLADNLKNNIQVITDRNPMKNTSYEKEITDLLGRYDGDDNSFYKDLNDIFMRFNKSLVKQYEEQGLSNLEARNIAEKNMNDTMRIFQEDNNSPIGEEIKDAVEAKKTQDAIQEASQKIVDNSPSNLTKEYEAVNMTEAKFLEETFAYGWEDASREFKSKETNSEAFRQMQQMLQAGKSNQAISFMNQNKDFAKLYISGLLHRMFNRSITERPLASSAKNVISKLVMQKVMNNNPEFFIEQNGHIELRFQNDPNVKPTQEFLKNNKGYYNPGEESHIKPDELFVTIGEAYFPYARMIMDEVELYNKKLGDSSITKKMEMRLPKNGDKVYFRDWDKVPIEKKIKYGQDVASEILSKQDFNFLVNNNGQHRLLYHIKNDLLHNGIDIMNPELQYFTERLLEHDMRKYSYRANEEASARTSKMRQIEQFYSMVESKFGDRELDDILTDDNVSRQDKELIIASLNDINDLFHKYLSHEIMIFNDIRNIGELIDFLKKIKFNKMTDKAFLETILSFRVKYDYRAFLSKADLISESLRTIKNDKWNVQNFIDNMRDIENILASYQNNLSDNIFHSGVFYKISNSLTNTNLNKLFDKIHSGDTITKNEIAELGPNITQFLTSLQDLTEITDKSSYNDKKSIITQNALSTADKFNNEINLRKKQDNSKVFELDMMVGQNEKISEDANLDTISAIRRTIPDASDTPFVYAENLKSQFKKARSEAANDEVFLDNTLSLWRDRIYPQLSDEAITAFDIENLYSFTPDSNKLATTQGQLSLAISTMFTNGFSRAREKMMNRILVNNGEAINPQIFAEQANLIKFKILTEDGYSVPVKTKELDIAHEFGADELYKASTGKDRDTTLRSKPLTTSEKLEIIGSDPTAIQELQPNTYMQISDSQKTPTKQYKNNIPIDEIFNNYNKEKIARTPDEQNTRDVLAIASRHPEFIELNAMLYNLDQALDYYKTYNIAQSPFKDVPRLRKNLIETIGNAAIIDFKNKNEKGKQAIINQLVENILQSTGFKKIMARCDQEEQRIIKSYLFFGEDKNLFTESTVPRDFTPAEDVSKEFATSILRDPSKDLPYNISFDGLADALKAINELYNHIGDQIANAQKTQASLNRSFNINNLANSTLTLDSIKIDPDVELQVFSASNKNFREKSKNKFLNSSDPMMTGYDGNLPHFAFLVRALFNNGVPLSWNKEIGKKGMSLQDAVNEVANIYGIPEILNLSDDPSINAKEIEDYIIRNNDLIADKYWIEDSNGKATDLTSDNLSYVLNALTSNSKDGIITSDLNLRFTNDFFDARADLQKTISLLLETLKAKRAKSKLDSKATPWRANMSERQRATQTHPIEILDNDIESPEKIQALQQKIVSEHDAYVERQRKELSQEINFWDDIMASDSNEAFKFTDTFDNKFILLFTNGIIVEDKQGNRKRFSLQAFKNSDLSGDLAEARRVYFTFDDYSTVIDRLLDVIHETRAKDEYSKLNNYEKLSMIERAIRDDFYSLNGRTLNKFNPEDLLATKNLYSATGIKSNDIIKPAIMKPDPEGLILSPVDQPESFARGDVRHILNWKPKPKTDKKGQWIKVDNKIQYETPKYIIPNPKKDYRGKDLEKIYNYIRMMNSSEFNISDKEIVLSEQTLANIKEDLNKEGYKIQNVSFDEKSKLPKLVFKTLSDKYKFLPKDITSNGTNVPVYEVFTEINPDNFTALGILPKDATGGSKLPNGESLPEAGFVLTKFGENNTFVNLDETPEQAEKLLLNVDPKEFDIGNMHFIKDDKAIDEIYKMLTTDSYQGNYALPYNMPVDHKQALLNFITYLKGQHFRLDISDFNNTQQLRYSKNDGPKLPETQNVLGIIGLREMSSGKEMILPVITDRTSILTNEINIEINPDNLDPRQIFITRSGSDSIANFKSRGEAPSLKAEAAETRSKGSVSPFYSSQDYISADSSENLFAFTSQDMFDGKMTQESNMGKNLDIANLIYSAAISSAKTGDHFDVLRWAKKSNVPGVNNLIRDFETSKGSLDWRPSGEQQFISYQDQQFWAKLASALEKNSKKFSESMGLSDDAITLLVSAIRSTSQRFRQDPRDVLSTTGLLMKRPQYLTGTCKFFNENAINTDDRLLAIKDLFGSMYNDKDFYTRNFDENYNRIFRYIDNNGTPREFPVKFAYVTFSPDEIFTSRKMPNIRNVGYSHEMNNYLTTGQVQDIDQLINYVLAKRGNLNGDDFKYIKTDFNPEIDDGVYRLNNDRPTLIHNSTGHDLDEYTARNYSDFRDGLVNGPDIIHVETEDRKSKTPTNTKLTEISEENNKQIYDDIKSVMDNLNSKYHTPLSMDDKASRDVVMRFLMVESSWTRTTKNDKTNPNGFTWTEDIVHTICEVANSDIDRGLIGFDPSKADKEFFYVEPSRTVRKPEYDSKGKQKIDKTTGKPIYTEEIKPYRDLRMKSLVYDIKLQEFLDNYNIPYTKIDSEGKATDSFRTAINNIAELKESSNEAKRKVLLSYSAFGNQLNGLKDNPIFEYFQTDADTLAKFTMDTLVALGEQGDIDLANRIKTDYDEYIKKLFNNVDNNKWDYIKDPDKQGIYVLKKVNEDGASKAAIRKIIRWQRTLGVSSPLIWAATHIDTAAGRTVWDLFTRMQMDGTLPLQEYRNRLFFADDNQKIHDATRGNASKGIGPDKSIIAFIRLKKLMQYDENFKMEYLRNQYYLEDQEKIYNDYVARRKNNQSGFENFQDNVMKIMTAQDFLIQIQAEIYVRRLMIELGNDPIARQKLMAVDSEGHSLLEKKWFDAEQNGRLGNLIALMSTPNAELGTEIGARSDRALQASSIGEMAQRNAVAYVFDYLTKNKPFTQVAMTTFGTRFLNASLNITGRAVDKFIPVMKIGNYSVTKLASMIGKSANGEFADTRFKLLNDAINKCGKITKENEGKFFKMLKDQNSIEAFEAMSIYTSLKEAALSQAISFGFNALGWGLAGSLLFQGPEDETMKNDYRNYTFCGIPVESAWWMNDLLGPAFLWGAFAKSCTEGNPRFGMIFSGLADICSNNPAFKVSSFVQNFLMPLTGDNEDLKNEIDSYETSNEGEPAYFEALGTRYAFRMLDPISTLITPAVARDIASMTENIKSYKRKPKKNADGSVSQQYDEYGTTEKVDYAEAQLRKLCRGNPIWGTLFSVVNGDSSFVPWLMPDVVVSEPLQVQCMKQYDVTNKSDQEIDKICLEVLTILNENDDMDALYKSGFYLSSATKNKVADKLSQWYKAVQKEYSNIQSQGYLNYYIAGNGNYNEGMKRVAEFNQIYKEQLQQINSLYKDKLFSKELNQGLMTYNMKNTTWRKNSEGNTFASGVNKSGIAALSPIFIGSAGNNIQSGAANNYAAKSQLTGQAMFNQDGTPMRNLVPASSNGYVPDISNWDSTSNSNSNSTTSTSSSKSSSSRSGGGSSGSKSIYSHSPSLNISNAATPRSSTYHTATYDYLRPEYYTQGSRYANRKSSL